MNGQRPSFVWFELTTPDLAASESFYGAVTGWTAERTTLSGKPYAWLSAGGLPVAGMTEAADQTPGWTGSIQVERVETAVERATQAGGRLLAGPEDVPDMVRFAVLADPQGAIFGVFHALSPMDMPPRDPSASGSVVWSEYYANDLESAFGFYAGQFGWTKADSLDMGPMGEYRIIAAGNGPMGGMMTKPGGMTAPFWLFYVTVADLAEAQARVTEQGGQVLNGPMEVPGGRILQCLDPQGAMFALHQRNGDCAESRIPPE